MPTPLPFRLRALNGVATFAIVPMRGPVRAILFIHGGRFVKVFGGGTLAHACAASGVRA